MSDRFLYWLLSGFFTLGLIMLAAAVWESRQTAQFLNGAERAEGEVVRVTVSMGPGIRLTDAHVRFQAGDGQWHVFRTGYDSRGEVVGDRLPVIYRPEDPTDARVDGLLSLWFVAAVWAFLGVSFAGLPVFWLFTIWRQVRDGPVMRRPPRKPRLPS